MQSGKAIYNLLDGNAGVGSRIYPVKAPKQATLPYIVYKMISVVPSNTVNKTSSVDTVHMQLDIVATTYSEAMSIAELVRSVLPTRTQDTHGTSRTIQQIEYLGFLGDAWDGQDTDSHIVSMDFSLREVVSTTD